MHLVVYKFSAFAAHGAIGITVEPYLVCDTEQI